MKIHEMRHPNKMEKGEQGEDIKEGYPMVRWKLALAADRKGVMWVKERFREVEGEKLLQSRQEMTNVYNEV